MTSSTDNRPFPLSMANEDELVQVVTLQAGRGLDRRLTDLGLNIGTQLTVKQRQPGGALVVSRDGIRFALGSGMAHKIMVIRA